MINKYIYFHEVEEGSERLQRWKLRRKWRDENRKPGGTKKARLFVGILWGEEEKQRMPGDKRGTMFKVFNLRSWGGTKSSKKSFEIIAFKETQRNRKQADLKITNNNSKQYLKLC
jgi:hypothetical protein